MGLLSIELLLVLVKLALVLQQVLVLVERIGVTGGILVERLRGLLQIYLHLIERVRLLVTTALASRVNHHRPWWQKRVVSITLVDVHGLACRLWKIIE